MNIHPDFEELLRLLDAHSVDYMIVGGYAVAFHGYPRFTKDIDIFYDSSPANAERAQQALLAFGFPATDLPLDLLAAKGNIITFGVAPTRVDFVSEIAAVEFADARLNTVRGRYGHIEVVFIGRDDLLKNKRATGRTRDLGDAEELEL